MFISIILLLLSIFFILLQLKPRRPKNFPPGPPILPLLGNLLNLNSSDPLKGLQNLRKTYGDVYSVFFGQKAVVIINGLEAIREAMVTKGTDFAGRPKDMFVSHLTNNRGLIMADYATSWRDHRRFAVTTLKNFGLGKKSMEQRIYEEIQYTIETLEQNIGKTLSSQLMFHNVASNIICKILFGTRYEHNDEKIQVIVECFTNFNKTVYGPWALLYDSLPALRCLPLPVEKTFKNIETFHSITNRLVMEHRNSRVLGEPRDIIDCYIDELDKEEDNSSFSEEQLQQFTFDIYLGGTDTTSNTLLTGFLYLMHFPQVQDRCQQEIDQVLEGKEHASFEDRHNMPYMQAVIHEIQRIADVVPLGAPHCTTKDTELMGYVIPKGTMIIHNLSSVMMEEGHWKFPHKFNPENFLNNDGEFVKPEAFMPFSLGPRVCLGESLARMELFLIMVTLLRKFKFIWPEDAGKPDFTPIFGGTLSPKPYCMKVQLRSTL